jgi:twitching motility protein PilI
MERRIKVALAGAAGDDVSVEEWVGIGFRLGTERFIVGREEVREILMVPTTVTRVPGAKAWIRGLANIRGHLLPIADLRAYLGAGVGGMSRGGRVLVLNGGDFPVGLVVDEVFGFRRFLDRERAGDTPETAIRCERYVDGVFTRGGETWPIFSTRRLLAADEFCRAAAD